jgi:hypothetical protein
MGDGFGKGAREKSDCNVGGANAGKLWDKARGLYSIGVISIDSQRWRVNVPAHIQLKGDHTLCSESI